jgi:acyl-CoA synthetase (AMP-forming)/AMP-acid ligase II
MSSRVSYWTNEIVVEKVGGVPFRMYAERPRRIESLLGFARYWRTRPYIVHGERVLTFDELLPATAAKARYLRDRGVAKGQHVLILGWNSPDWVVNFWACLRIGAIPVLGNAWWSDSDISYAVELVAPALILADARGASKVPTGSRLGAWVLDTPSNPEPFNDGLEPGSPPSDENQAAIVIFTSGTEGRAKAVVLSHRSFLASMLMMLDVTHRLPLSPDEKLGEACLHTGPLFHVGGPHALLRGVVVGNTLVFPTSRFEPGEALQLIEHYRISRWTAVPTMINRLLDHPDLSRHDLSSLKAIAMGGAPVHSEFLERINQRFPGAATRLAVGYGLSENGGQATAASGKNSASRPGSSGRALPLVEIRIGADDQSKDGEILIRSPTQMLGYFGASTSPIDAEGWLHTGDLGRRDTDGLLWITGRSKDIIIRGGENIAPAAVERALMALPSVAEAAVMGVPHPDLGEEVMAIVVVKDSVTAVELQSRLREALPSFAVPTRWKLQTDPLPTNHTGKVDKPRLVAQVRSELGLSPEHRLQTSGSS